jgi:tRNA U34 5-carboxymethylaminomethyl modifying GTPase MnmE/TrmE
MTKEPTEEDCNENGDSGNMTEDKTTPKPKRPDHDEVQGLHEGWAVNWKRQVARELDLDETLQGQYLVLREKLQDNYVKTNAEMDAIKLKNFQAFSNSMDERQKDVSLARERHEKKLEERMEELEETMTRQVATINEAVAGIDAATMHLTEMYGRLKGSLESEDDEE